MRNLNKRIDELEKAARRKRGFVIATQDLDDPDLFTLRDGKTCTDAELTKLSDDGWQVIRVVYTNKWRAKNEADPAL